MKSLICATALGVVGGCAGDDARRAAPPLQLREAFPMVRVDAAAKVVEFDARVSPMLVPDAKAPLFFLEVICCSPDSREHETFVVTDAKPSHIHAALLSIGLRAGHPGSFRQNGRSLEPVDPAGDRIDVRFVYVIDGREIEADPLAWVCKAGEEGSGFVATERAWATAHAQSAPGWTFCGSRFVERGGREVYDADGTGVLIGLTTFGSEVIGWSRTISPDSDVQEPEWVADFKKTPPAGLPVRVRVRPAR